MEGGDENLLNSVRLTLMIWLKDKSLARVSLEEEVKTYKLSSSKRSSESRELS